MRVNVVSIAPTVCNMPVFIKHIDVDVVNMHVNILNMHVLVLHMSVLMINMTMLSCNRHCNMIAACVYKYNGPYLDNYSHETIISVLQNRSSRRQETLTSSV